MCRVRYCDGCSECEERHPCDGCELCNDDVCACPDGGHLAYYGVVAGVKIGDCSYCLPCGEKERLALLDDARLEAEAVPVAVDEDETTPVPVETMREIVEARLR